MNTKSLRFITTAALSLALAAPATVFADGARNRKAGGPHAHADKNGDGVVTQSEVPARRWERIKNADSNKDGKLTKDELAAFFKAHKEARFKNADKNNDGSLTQNEVPAPHWERIKNADSNKDSKVTKDELSAFFKAHKDARFKNADKNGDGALTQGEVPAQRWERVKQADSNKDGKVTKDELAAFFKAHGHAKAGPRPQGKPGHGERS